MRVGRYLTSIKSQLSNDDQADLDRALAGDAIAARRLIIGSPKRLLAHVAFLAYQRKTRNPAYRELLKAAWQPKSRFLLTEFWKPEVVRRMLARADFERPALYGPLTVFLPVKASARGAAAQLCWTLSRKAAVADAIRINPARPRVLQATIAATDILHFEKGTKGVVVRRPLKAVTVDRVRGVGGEVATAGDPHERRGSSRA